MHSTKGKILKDSELIKKIIEDNKNDCFGILYDRYANKVYNKCISLVKNKETAQDLTHDIFLKAFVGLGGFKGTSAFSTWLYAITYNYCIDYLRKSKSFFDVMMVDKYKYLDSDVKNVNENSLNYMDINRLRNLLEKIPIDNKIILLMKYQDNMSIKDIQEAFNISESATKMRLKRAKEKLISIYNNLYRHSI